MNQTLFGFGYTKREAQFLELAALLSGYFVRRQFNDYIGRECGAVGQRFIERATTLGDVKVLPGLGGRTLYHVAASRVYVSCGDPENRNRRDHRPESIRRRLMALDYALSHPDANWLLTEAKKVEYFSALGISQADLPSAVFARTTTRFFVDRQPLFVGPDGAPSFTFIDQGLKTFTEWELFLRHHRSLLQKINRASVTFASCQEFRFERAHTLLRQMVGGEKSEGGIDEERLTRFFRLQKLFDEGRYDQFDQARLDELRESKRVFAGAAFDSAYQVWKATGNLGLSGHSGPRVTFFTQLLAHNYGWLSPIRILERRG